MATVPPEMKDSKNYIKICGLDHSDGSAKEAMFSGDQLLVSSPADAYKHQIFVYDSDGNVTYIGRHANHKESTASTDWKVWKYTWTSGNCTKIEGWLEGAWDDYSTLAWE